MNRFFSVLSPFYSPDDLGGGGGGTPSPAGGDTPAPSQSPAIQDTSAVAPATPNAAPAARPQIPEGYVPSYRLREIREQAQREYQTQWQQREAQYQAQIEATRRQLHAVVGVEPQNEEQQQIAAIQAQFKKVFPELAQMNERAKDLMGLLERSGDYDTAIQHQWQSYGRQSMDRLFNLAKTSLGHDLSDSAKQRLHASFAGYVQSSPELLNRYASDPTLIDEYWQDFENAFIGPVRRQSAASVQGAVDARPPLPRDTGSGVPPIAPVPKQQGSVEDRLPGAWQAFNAVKNQNR